MSQAIEFFEGLVKENISNVYTSLPCRVIAFYGDSADVQPIPKRELKDGRELPYPVLIKVPVLKRKYKQGVDIIVENTFYEEGDTVLVSFSNRDLSQGTIVGFAG